LRSKSSGINSHYYISPETAHEWQTWRRSLQEFAPLIFNASAAKSETSGAPKPASFGKETLAEGRVHLQIAAENTYTLQADGSTLTKRTRSR
jgi:hypothetical protein